MSKRLSVKVSRIVIDRFDHFPQLSKSSFVVLALCLHESPLGEPSHHHHVIEQPQLQGKGLGVPGRKGVKRVIKADQLCK